MSLWNPNTDFFDNYYDKGKYKFAWRLAILFLSIFGILSGIFLFLQTTATYFYVTVFVVVSIATFYLHKTKNYKIAFWTFIVTGSILVTISLNTILDTAHYSDFLWVIAIILFGFVSLDKKVGIFFTIIHCFNILYYFKFTFNPHINTLRNQEGAELIGVAVEVTLGLIVISYLIAEFLKFQEFAKKELQEKNEELEHHIEIINTKSRENEVLIKEVHHRVKNNLQIIVSMLRMQMGELKNPESVDHFNQAINRIMAISLIHQKIYQFDDLSQVDTKVYLNDLSEAIINSSNLDIAIETQVNAPELNIDIESIVPIGLLVNELVLNSTKHAFTNQDKGSIHISLTQNDQSELHLSYSDSGNWLENNSDGFGLQLIDALTRQMDGQFTRNGSSFEFNLSLN